MASAFRTDFQMTALPTRLLSEVGQAQEFQYCSSFVDKPVAAVAETPQIVVREKMILLGIEDQCLWNGELMKPVSARMKAEP